MAFQPGNPKTGGRTKGTPNRATADFKAFWQHFLQSDAYRANLKRRILHGEAGHMERYLAELLYGRPAQNVRVVRPEDEPVEITLDLGKPPALNRTRRQSNDEPKENFNA